eukprot:Em0017g77a
MFGPTDDVIRFFRTRNLLASSVQCTRCQKPMLECTRSDVRDGVGWKCSSCKTRWSEVCSTRLINDGPVMLGGNGVVVQIDKSLFKHKPKEPSSTLMNGLGCIQKDITGYPTSTVNHSVEFVNPTNAVNEGKLSLASGNIKDSPFVCGGFSNWKDATVAFARHEQTTTHKKAVEVLVMILKQQGTSERCFQLLMLKERRLVDNAL